MSGSNAAPVIIKRKKVVGGDGHHGGAWKVAYADFVTAMMAFFMLMWLLNATTEKQRKGIADYFNPTIPVNRISGGGEGSFGGTSVFSEELIAQNGTGASSKHPTEARQARGQSGLDKDGAKGDIRPEPTFEDIERKLLARGGESMASDGLLEHIITRVTDEGLIVELFDTRRAALFSGDTDQPTPQLTQVIDIVSETFAASPNAIAVNVHTRAYPTVLRTNPAWSLSTDRAQAARAAMERAGLNPDRFARVTGNADRDPVTRDPMAPRNNRVQLILLRSAPF